MKKLLKKIVNFFSPPQHVRLTEKAKLLMSTKDFARIVVESHMRGDLDKGPIVLVHAGKMNIIQSTTRLEDPSYPKFPLKKITIK